MNLFADTVGKVIYGKLAWLNEPENWTFNRNGLEISAPPESDFFYDEEGSSFRCSAPFLYTYAEGDFDLTTRVNIEMTQMFDSGCLMIMSDMDHWAKLCYENWINEPSIISVVTKTFSDDCPSLRIGKVKPYLRALRSGNCFSFHYSLDGLNWTLIRYFNMDVPKKIKVGVVAQSPAGKGCLVKFDLLNLILGPVKSAKHVPELSL